ncbi:MAG: biopolymer transporter ExbD [Lentisphaeria bacterium]|nr:biopolymer transporter ExbD [Lentisphaeria bacterium]
MRIRKKDDDDVTLEMSPLIDCVFLLLIFFLITTMMKKLEKQIPIEVPDPDVTISERMDARRVILAIGKDGRYYSAERRLQDGRPDFRAIGDVDKFVENLGRMTQGAGEEINVRLYADPDVEFQTVIDMLDKLQINHLNKVDVRMRDYRESRFYIPGSSD